MVNANSYAKAYRYGASVKQRERREGCRAECICVTGVDSRGVTLVCDSEKINPSE